MKYFRCFASTLNHTVRASLPSVLLLALLGLPATVRSEIDMGITQSIWKMVYNVTDAQINSATWLAADDDGDGITNGAEIAAGTDPHSNGSTVRITTMSVTDGVVSLTFPTIAYKQYLIQSTTTLGSNWLPLGNDAQFDAHVNPPGLTWAKGDGTPTTLTIAQQPNTFYRVLVQDLDTDGDGVSDWAEVIAGYDPNNSHSNGATADDHASMVSAVAATNVVTVTVSKPNATQPVDSLTAPLETGTVTVTRTGLLLSNITVPLAKLGSAVEGTDYSSLPTSVTLLGSSLPYNPANPNANKKIGQVVLTINPLGPLTPANARRTNVTAIVKALAATSPGGSGNYTLGSTTSGTVVINPPGLANGTGLTAKYFNTSNSTYSPGQTTIFGGTAAMSRTDAVVDFGTTANTIVSSIALGNPCVVTTTRANALTTGDSVTIAGVTGGTPSINGNFVVTVTSGTTFTIPVNLTALPTSVTSATITPLLGNGWGQTAGPRGMSPASTNGAFSVRWTGQILPKYTETYTIDFRSDDSAKVWVNGQLLIDRWATQGAADYVNTIALTAGTLYDIQIDYWNSSGVAEAKLYWWSPNTTKEIIPQSRLFPAPPTQGLKPTPITSSLTAVGYETVPFNFSVVVPDIGGTKTYALDPNSGPLPSGLALSSAGAITGTPAGGSAGTYNVAINATNTGTGNTGNATGSSVVNMTIFPTGSVTRETLAGQSYAADGTIPTLDDTTEYGNNVARRLRGYIVPPKTGNYYFWLAASNAAELWISNDSQAVNRVRRARVTSSTGSKIWKDLTPLNTNSQQTPWLALVAGQKYYFEVLHNTGTVVGDYVSMGWCQDDIGTVPAVTGAANPTGAAPLIPNGGAALAGYPLSGTVPSYIFQPYDYPTLAPATGMLYAANLGPQGSANSKASGGASIQVNQAETQAILHFSYQNLSSPRTAYHLHADTFTGSDNVFHPQGEIIFDIDEADTTPGLKAADGGYTWVFAPVGTFTSVAQIVDAIHKSKVYLNVHTVNYPAGEIRGNLSLINGRQSPPDTSTYTPPPGTTDLNTTDAGAARFLNHATFGASPADIASVKSLGFAGWITDQISKSASHISDDVVAGITADINAPYPSTLFTDTWWKKSITGPDQLRQRFAFAMSEIMVVSWNNNTGPLNNNGRILADYYDQLIDYGLPTAGLQDSGTFRGILKAVTLTPAMGLYLDMRANQKGDDSAGRHPNENYAREIMQLFSVGLNRQWDDGSFVLDSNGGLVATYTQVQITGLAALLTGWNYAQPNQASGRAPTSFGPAADYLNPMVLVPGQHDLGAKLLLNGVVTPPASGQTPRVSIGSIGTGSPCTVNTSTVHGLTTGDTVWISGVTSGTYNGVAPSTANINQAFAASVTGPQSFTVPVNCTVAGGVAGTVTGATVKQPTYTFNTTNPIPPITGSQADNAGTTLPHPYDQYGLTELDRAIDQIVNNDNVPPYICRQLIQRLVTSDPSPGYLYRVVQKFKDNGSGVRGDMTAVLTQILTDGEARSSSVTQTSTIFGKQREPMLRLTGPARAFPANGYTGTYAQLTGLNANKFRITTSAPNDISSSFTINLDFRANYLPANGGGGASPPTPSTNPTSTNYGVNGTLNIAQTWTDISAIDVASPARVHTVEPHGLVDGNAVIISGVTGGTFSAPLTTQRIITWIDANTFDVQGVNCTVAPGSVSAAKMVSNPCRITTQVPHGLATGNQITIGGVSGGAFSPTISGTQFTVTFVDATSFTLSSPSCNCTSPATINTGSITGATTLDVTDPRLISATYTQAANNNLLTVNTTGPQTNIVLPGASASVSVTGISVGNPCTVTVSGAANLFVTGGLVTIAGTTDGTFDTPITGTFTPTMVGNTGTMFTIPVNCTVAPTTIAATTTKLIRSKVYLMFLSQTTAGGAVQPANGIYEVQSTNGTSNFTIMTADTPATGRGGNTLLPRVATSYSPVTISNVTSVQFNTNINHNMVAGNTFWCDVPVVGNALADAEYTMATVAGALLDEDHLATSYLPTNNNGGTYAKPSGSTNSVTIYPLIPPVLGRNGVVTINASSFILGSTEGTMTQSPLNSPTVFNYFFPNYKYPGVLANSGLDSPEFQLTTDTNVMTLTNTITNMLIGTGGGNGNVNGLMSFNNGGGSVVMDIGKDSISNPELPPQYIYMSPDSRTANAGIPTLVDDLANLLIGAPLDPTTRTTIVNFVANTTNFPYTTPIPSNLQKRDRIRAIIHLILTSAEYAVQK